MKVQCAKYPYYKGTLPAPAPPSFEHTHKDIHCHPWLLENVHSQFSLVEKNQQMIAWVFLVLSVVNLCLEVKLPFPQDFITTVTTGLKFWSLIVSQLSVVP